MRKLIAVSLLIVLCIIAIGYIVHMTQATHINKIRAVREYEQKTRTDGPVVLQLSPEAKKIYESTLRNVKDIRLLVVYQIEGSIIPSLSDMEKAMKDYGCTIQTMNTNYVECVTRIYGTCDNYVTMFIRYYKNGTILAWAKRDIPWGALIRPWRWFPLIFTGVVYNILKFLPYNDTAINEVLKSIIKKGVYSPEDPDVRQIVMVYSISAYGAVAPKVYTTYEINRNDKIKMLYLYACWNTTVYIDGAEVVKPSRCSIVIITPNSPPTLRRYIEPGIHHVTAVYLNYYTTGWGYVALMFFLK